MKIRRTLKERMRLIEASGLGHFHEEAGDGQIIFSTDLKDGRLHLFIDGFCLERGGAVDKVSFSDISSVDSHLKVEMFSDASRLNNLDLYVPLDIKCGSFSLSLFLPLLTYSNVMNVLVGLRDDWNKRVPSGC